MSSVRISLVIRLAEYAQEADSLPRRDLIPQHFNFMVDMAVHIAFVKRLIGAPTFAFDWIFLPKLSKLTEKFLAPVNIVIVVMKIFARNSYAHPTAADCLRYQRL